MQSQQHKSPFADVFPSRLFTRSLLPYWSVLVLDAATIPLAGMCSVYLTLGGVSLVGSFWDYVAIWFISLPLFLLTMFFFRSYRGIVRKSMSANLVGILSALLTAGIILQLFCELAPNVIFPFRPALRATALTILISAVLQTVYRWVAKQFFFINASGKIVAVNPFRPNFISGGTEVDNSLGERKRINLCLAHMSEAGLEKKYVQEAFDTNWVVPLGPNVNAFEADLEKFVGQEKRVAALSAGTAAVHLALKACGVGPGDEVCVQTFTFCASCNPIAYLGATPVFIDSEPRTWNMDPHLLDLAIRDRIERTGRKPKAIIPVALYGMPYNAQRIMDIANRYEIPVIEDAAEGFGSRFDGRVLGTFGQFGVLSFNGNKMITTSGGGALICADRPSRDNVLWYATQAREAYPYYQHEAIGYNYRMSNVCAGIGRGQMTVVDDHIAHHKHVQALYEELLKDERGILVHSAPPQKGQNGEKLYDSNYWLCAITIDPTLKVKGQENAYKRAIQSAVGGAGGVIHMVDSPTTDCQPNANVEALRVYLDAAQIEARPIWKPMHRQPVYRNAPSYLNGVSESIFKVGLCLPAGPWVKDEDVRYIVDTIKSAIER